MQHAFRPEGPLADLDAVGSEQVGAMKIFAGAYAVLPTPPVTATSTATT
jgi:hypothetical protein